MADLLVIVTIKNGHGKHGTIAVGAVRTLNIGTQIVEHVQSWLILDVVVASQKQIDLEILS